MKRALTIATTIYTVSRLARLFVMPPRPTLDPARQGPRVDLVKWEQEPEPRRISWDPAADLLDEAAAEDALIVHSGWGVEFITALDESEGCDDLLAALDGEA